jgi:hypothetical protein
MYLFSEVIDMNTDRGTQMNAVVEKDLTETPKVTTAVHLMAGWPMFLVVIGGVIGALLSVFAYIINRKIYSSHLSKFQKVMANLLCGMSAIAAWWFIAQWVQASI